MPKYTMVYNLLLVRKMDGICHFGNLHDIDLLSMSLIENEVEL